MSWEPIYDTRSIERVRVILVFQEPLTQKTLLEVFQSFEKNASKDYGLNDYQEGIQTGRKVSTSDNAVQNPKPAPDTIISKFRKTMDSDTNNLLESLNISREHVTFEVMDYDHWKQFYKTFCKMIKQITDITPETVNISELSLEFWNKFVFMNAPEKANPSLLLKNLKPLLPKNVFTNGDLWYLNKGWFQTSSNGQEKILVKQEYTAHDATHTGTKKPHRLVAIRTIAAFKKSYSENLVDNLVKDLQTLHDVSKDALTTNFVDDMQKSVGL